MPQASRRHQRHHRARARRASGRALNQTVIVDNRGGSNGVIGAEAVARAPGDGYTIMFHSITSHVTNPAVYKKLAYDTINDFTPITQIAWVPLVIVIHPSFPAKNTGELIAIAKAQPGEINYASFGQGSMSHLAGELLKMMAKIDIVHIPQRRRARAHRRARGPRAARRRRRISTRPGFAAQSRVVGKPPANPLASSPPRNCVA